MGGRVALHFAAAYPTKVRRLILESASPGLATEAERLERRANDEALACEIELHGVEDFVRRWERLPLFESQLQLPNPVRAERHAQRLRNTEAGLASALRGLGTGALPSLWDVLPNIQAQTLIIAGELDAKFVEIGEQMAAAIPQAQLLILSGAGHTVHLERPRRWVEAVGEFISSI
jgi:2-succinyl-6-hydroxy-2,4-cyclohexadiene-1-carboxylate synthase